MFWRTGHDACMTKQSTSYFTIVTFTLSMSRPSVSKYLISIIFSDEVTSCNTTKNLPPLTCRYCPNRSSRRLLWNLDVNTRSYLSPSKSSISDARQRRVLTSAEPVCAVNINLSQLGILFVCHAWTRSVIACRNDGFWSPVTATFPR